jgi:hydrogenase expression/formation protein HypC
MCLAVPGKITAMEGDQARVDMAGNVVEADLSLIEDPAVGDWVLVHAGFAIEKMDEQEAADTLDLFREMEGIGGVN